jgi:hypothetical protein
MPIIKIPKQYLIDQNEDFITVDVPASVVSFWQRDYAKVTKAKGLLKDKRDKMLAHLDDTSGVGSVKYLYDTNIFIYYLAEEPAVLPLFSEAFLSQHEVITSSIVRIKLLSFPELSNEIVQSL